MDNSNSALPINWYPGHMAKTKRILSEQIRKIDLVIELCDARLPHSSRNPVIQQLAAGRKRIVFLNKSDLADPAETARWLKGNPAGRNRSLCNRIHKAENQGTDPDYSEFNKRIHR